MGKASVVSCFNDVGPMFDGVLYEKGYICALGRRPLRVLVVCEWVADVVAARQVQWIRIMATNTQNRRKHRRVAHAAIKSAAVGTFLYGRCRDIRIKGAPSSDGGTRFVAL
jgi:hypothetical protein